VVLGWRGWDQVELSRALGHTGPQSVNKWMSRNPETFRPMRRKSAQKIEGVLGLPTGFLATPWNSLDSLKSALADLTNTDPISHSLKPAKGQWKAEPVTVHRGEAHMREGGTLRADAEVIGFPPTVGVGPGLKGQLLRDAYYLEMQRDTHDANGDIKASVAYGIAAKSLRRLYNILAEPPGGEGEVGGAKDKTSTPPATPSVEGPDVERIAGEVESETHPTPKQEEGAG